MPLTAISITRSGRRQSSLQGRFFDTTDVAGVVVVHFVFALVAGNSNFFCVQNDDVILVNVRSVFRLCLPRRRRASSVARRPRVLPVASTTYQSRFTVSGLAVKVFIKKLTQIISYTLVNTQTFSQLRFTRHCPANLPSNSLCRA